MKVIEGSSSQGDEPFLSSLRDAVGGEEYKMRALVCSGNEILHFIQDDNPVQDDNPCHPERLAKDLPYFLKFQLAGRYFCFDCSSFGGLLPE